uniref:ORF037 n=1 Tax=Spodoptera frugiperda granulovirus TaxID=307454 RepID=A0A346QVV6_9BBAC|nr:ORF037 [Spodoptera frugiperda granulovirus]
MVYMSCGHMACSECYHKIEASHLCPICKKSFDHAYTFTVENIKPYNVELNHTIQLSGSHDNINRKFTCYEIKKPVSVIQIQDKLHCQYESNMTALRNAISYNELNITRTRNNGTILPDRNITDLTKILNEVRLIHSKIHVPYFDTEGERNFYKKLNEDINLAVTCSKILTHTSNIPEYKSRNELYEIINDEKLLQKKQANLIKLYHSNNKRMNKRMYTYINKYRKSTEKYKSLKDKLQTVEKMYKLLMTKHQEMMKSSIENEDDASMDSLSSPMSSDSSDNDDEIL